MKVKNMNPKRITNNLLKEEYFYLKHPSGLDVYVYPKKGCLDSDDLIKNTYDLQILFYQII